MEVTLMACAGMALSTAESPTETPTAVGRVVHALTVDVEDYFQVSGFEGRVCRKDWDRYESRVESSTDRMLSLFDQHEVQGTFFVLGWIAERFPLLIKRIAAAGHEIASHGYWHELVYNLTPEAFAQDIADSKDAICTACGIEPTAYRAPSFSITEKSLWALEILVQQGFTDDSSIFPIRGHDRYGMRNAKKQIHILQTPAGPIREFPPSIVKVRGLSVPIGGGYFRLLPLRTTSQAICKIQTQNRPAMFYTHPWEIDPDQPRISGLRRGARFRHYVGLRRTETKLRQMLAQHRFDSMSRAVAQAVQPTNETINTTNTIVTSDPELATNQRPAFDKRKS